MHGSIYNFFWKWEPNSVEIERKNVKNPNYLYEIYKFVALKKFSLEFNKRVAPNKVMLEGKLSLELISVQHVY